MANNVGGHTFDRLVFPKDPTQFGVWKDMIIGHLRQKSASLRREAMLKELNDPAFNFEDLLRSSWEVPRPMDTDDAELMRKFKWQMVTLSEQDAYIRSMLTQTLPRAYQETLRISYNDVKLPAAWATGDGLWTVQSSMNGSLACPI